MARVLLVGQETGGVGKSTIVRGLAEAVEEAAIIELELVHRLLEFKQTAKANVKGNVRWLEMRASRKEIDDSAGLAALSELDAVINTLYEVSVPTIVDIGANTSASLFVAMRPEVIEDLHKRKIELGVVLVVAEESGSLADAAKLLHAAKDWAAPFVVANDIRGPVDRDMLAKVAGDAKVTELRKFGFEAATSTLLQASALRGYAISIATP